MELKVLSNNKIGKIFCFNVSKKKDEKNVVQLKYIGRVHTNTHISYKILTWARVSGKNYHTTGVIELFDTNNNYVGKYVLGDMSDLPEKIEGNNLIFANKNKENCDKSLVTKVSFDSIPKNIFIKCEGDEGDVYSYISNN
ncbi:hypothetical protein [Arachidicoccus sp.]|uniref:hypothetical protein n=1 Tax=Arachidicoccus sp. TaxID=1872624 RepID=UPI003D21EF43